MATNLTYNRQAVGIQACVNGMLQIRNGRDLLRNGISELQCMIDGDGSQDSHYANMATVCSFPDAATAHASWNELNSMYAKVSQDGSTDTVATAITQCCSKHGV